jgi:hydroxymethylpyrimidine/phosphomethylpyrimidine kinase
VEHARAFVRGALEAGARVRTGAGSGPLNHGYAPQTLRLLPLP